ncbi:MAG: elongation factor 4 [Candidatus Taylorbacteria bacterium RIFCSPLOWO2_12_FULL_48_11]|nr:MAG: elongation factor 4 [Candidatus Taylorbacteria bacterium RIFCSPLOWO2_12_FULL_48_11]
MAQLNNIRNFCIISHVDHGKSTLADRLLEITGTIEKRKMRAQVLDSMDLERERGITIKMTPVRMAYQEYILNLIDTPGHIDFSYEVSRALRAVEGAVLLVDATQGVQAQTITVLHAAQAAGLTIIPVVNKVDSQLARVPETKKEIALLLGCGEGEILEVSGKTGQWVPELLEEVIKRVPPPRPADSALPLKQGGDGFRALIFDFKYSNHAGVVVYCRVFGGTMAKGARLKFAAAGREFTVIEVGTFSPEETAANALSAGEIGYIVTGVKEPGVASVGDTVVEVKGSLSALPGYARPSPVVWASFFPESGDEFNALRHALGRLRLSDSAFTAEEESSGALGRGFRCGFLGMLHLEIISERLRREFKINLVVTHPSIAYEVLTKRVKKITAYTIMQFPEHGEVEEVREQWVAAELISPPEYLAPVMLLLGKHEARVGETENIGNRFVVRFEAPLRELMRGFFDELKSVSSGFASLSYRLLRELRKADVVKMEILVADDPMPAFGRVVSRRAANDEAEAVVEKLSKILPRQQFELKIQARVDGKIVASRRLTALRKDVTGYLYGGDRTRKMKLWKQQKEGKKRLAERGRVEIPAEAFVKMLQ